MSKKVSLVLVSLIIVVAFFLIKWLTCPLRCGLKYPKEECTPGMIGCPYAGCASNCYLICIGKKDITCILPSPFWAKGLSK